MSRMTLSLLAVALLLLTSCNLPFPEPPPLACFDNQRPLALSRVENPAGLPYVPGQLLVRYQEPPGLQPQDHLSVAAAVQASFQLTLLQDGGGYGPDLVQVPPGQDVRALAAILSADPRVKYAEPNYFLYTLATFPNDQLLPNQWNMLNFGLPQAWSLETGSPEITIAIIDTGVDRHHQDLAGRLWPGCDFGDRDNDPNPDAGTVGSEHGTHVAGIAAATGNNGVGVAGVAYREVRILPVKASGSTGLIATYDVAVAIRWAAGLTVTVGVGEGNREVRLRNPHPAQIINISLGAPRTRTNQTLDEAVQRARAEGAIVIAAAGNTDTNTGAIGDGIFTPANAPYAIAVGSVDNDRKRSSFSNFNTIGRTVDVMAPGGAGPCLTTSGVLSTLPGNQYGCMQGTSMAAPFVAGVAALIWSREPSLTADQVIERLRGTTYFNPDTMNPAEYGRGIVCADAALGATTTCGGQ